MVRGDAGVAARRRAHRLQAALLPHEARLPRGHHQVGTHTVGRQLAVGFLVSNVVVVAWLDIVMVEAMDDYYPGRRRSPTSRGGR